MIQRAAKLLSGGTVTAMAAYLAYDYQTCHPFRKMHGYDVAGAWIRFHNTFRPSITYPSMTLQDLNKYNGHNGRPTYFSSDGRIWDVSDSETFHSSYGFFEGKDATFCLAKMSMEKSEINQTNWDALADKEWESLYSWTKYFSEKYMIRGRLKEYAPKR
ncbi:unnamed protein product [Cylindrotheca closterium]|uniref:Cytochrome b5 heme-binding domain-containing protein n=1 Tax=Cylindrotheca closterium TaxID=2856 RepID=A0AAD2JJF8_9STRA|nr:unnamed protein product [Cylindrotheca closterium]